MPLPVISVAQMRDWEKESWAAGKSEAEVIRRVGKIVAEHALRMTRANDSILILAGKGHNGDDARHAVEHLISRRVELLEIKNPETDFSTLDKMLSLRPALVVDGLFGIGINRPLNAGWIKLIERINSERLKILAVDVPSGLDAETGKPNGAAIQAAATLTVGAPKRGMLLETAWPFVGRLEVAADVGLSDGSFQSEINWTLAGDFADFPPSRPVASHKGSFGHLAILAGSIGFHGAGVLASRGAQRARPGLITLFPHESAYASCAAQLQAVMAQPWSPRVDLLGVFSAVLAGPGLAAPILPDELKRAIGMLWQNAAIPMVVDASALAWLPQGALKENAIRVITPHPGEAARLLETTSARVQSNRAESVRELSRRFGNCWIVLKGHQTLVGRSEGEIFVNSSGNPYLAQGGSGDVLSGFLAGLLAQPALQTDALKTIRFAVWKHGAAADRLEIEKPNWVVEDLVTELGI